MNEKLNTVLDKLDDLSERIALIEERLAIMTECEPAPVRDEDVSNFAVVEDAVKECSRHEKCVGCKLDGFCLELWDDIEGGTIKREHVLSVHRALQAERG